MSFFRWKGALYARRRCPVYLENVQALNNKGVPALRGVSLDVHAGEIVGIAGVAGNGQSELAECITGLRTCTKGRVLIGDLDVANQPPLAAIMAGVASTSLKTATVSGPRPTCQSPTM